MWSNGLHAEVREMFARLEGCGTEEWGYRVIERPGRAEPADRVAYKRAWNARNAERERARKRAWAKTPAGLEAKRRWKAKRRAA